MIYFFSYDISNPKRLPKIAKILENFGLRVQYSFFECEMNCEQKDNLVNSLLTVLDQDEDSLIVYPLCEACLNSVSSEGNGDLFKPTTFMVL